MGGNPLAATLGMVLEYKYILAVKNEWLCLVKIYGLLK